MLKAVVIDDEPFALEVIRDLTEMVSFIDIVEYFSSPIDAMSFLKKNKVDLLFLDINMPRISGIGLLKSFHNPPMVIFTTAHSEHAVEGFELDAIDYLLKPFSLTRFLKACNKAYEHVEQKRSKDNADPIPAQVFIKSNYERHRIELDALQYVEANGNYVVFVLQNQKFFSRLTMSEAEALLPEKYFIRIHRSFIVSKKCISKVDK